MLLRTLNAAVAVLCLLRSTVGADLPRRGYFQLKGQEGDQTEQHYLTFNPPTTNSEDGVINFTKSVPLHQPVDRTNIDHLKRWSRFGWSINAKNIAPVAFSTDKGPEQVLEGDNLAESDNCTRFMDIRVRPVSNDRQLFSYDPASQQIRLTLRRGPRKKDYTLCGNYVLDCFGQDCPPAQMPSQPICKEGFYVNGCMPDPSCKEPPVQRFDCIGYPICSDNVRKCEEDGADPENLCLTADDGIRSSNHLGRVTLVMRECRPNEARMKWVFTEAKFV